MICDFFWDEVSKHRRKEDVPPMLTTPKYFLFNVYREDMFFLAVVTVEVG